MQYWTGSAWATVPGGNITGNNKVWRKLTFTPITTSKIKVVVHDSGDGYSRVTELEAWGVPGGTATSNIQWLVADQLGTPRMVFDKTGSLTNVKRHDYLPFGEELLTGQGLRTMALGYGGGDGLRQKFTSKERDNETGLDYFVARYYSSTQGRFTSPDEPFADQRQSNPQSWNSYSYVRNNPCSNVDPNGKCSVPSGLQPGSTGICIEAFIAAPRISIAGRGDNRPFSGDNPDLTAKVRVDLIVTPKPETKNANIQEHTQAGTSIADVPTPAGILVPIPLEGAASTQITDAQTNEQGTTTFTATTTGTNGFQNLPIVGGLAPGGTIDITTNVIVTKDGKVGLGEGSSSKNFPSYAMYSYRYDEKGKIVTTEIFRREERKPKDLTGPMVPIPKVEPR